MYNDPFYEMINKESMPKSLARKISEESFSTDPFVKSQACIRHPVLDDFINNTCKFHSHAETNLHSCGNNVVQNLTFTENNLCGMSILRLPLNQSFRDDVLPFNINSPDPTGKIQKEAVNIIGQYWRVQRGNRTLDTLQGLIADSVKNHESDLIIEKDVDRTPNLTDSNVEIITQALCKMENDSNKPAAIIANSYDFAALYIRGMLKQTFFRDFYMMGIPVVQSDQLNSYFPDHTRAIPEIKSYCTCLLGEGAFITGSGFPKVPIAGWHEALRNNGGGATFLISRVEWALHPMGYTCTLDSLSNFDELKTANTWERRLERKHIPLTVIISR
jgi:hypothetical protein